jgi:hypothetical protein
VSLAVLVVAAGSVGVAFATGAIGSIVGADGQLHGCYKKENGQLRLVATGTACGPEELAVSWSQQGPAGAQGPAGPRGATGAQGPAGQTGTSGAAGAKGATGATGAKGATGATGTAGGKGATGAQGQQGDTGPAGPAYVATGLVAPDGTVLAQFATGPVPTVTETSPGTYTFSITGLGTGCPLPQLTGYSANVAMSFVGGGCGSGTLSNTTVTTGNGQDEYWAYMFVGVGSAGPSPLLAQARSAPSLPSGK